MGRGFLKAKRAPHLRRRPGDKALRSTFGQSPWPQFGSTSHRARRRKPSALTTMMGFLCTPSWASVATSKNSSKVQSPPGSTMKTSDICSINALRSCKCGVTINFSSGETGAIFSIAWRNAGIIPWTSEPASGPSGDVAHQPKAAATEHQIVAHGANAVANGARDVAEPWIIAEGGAAKDTDRRLGHFHKEEEGCVKVAIFRSTGSPGQGNGEFA